VFFLYVNIGIQTKLRYARSNKKRDVKRKKKLSENSDNIGNFANEEYEDQVSDENNDSCAGDEKEELPKKKQKGNKIKLLT
jgi:CRISPR/Cas system-associated protein Cas5 (RAMP superfamily)